jgi:imidazolonepropionase-like amidohydrolase
MKKQIIPLLFLVLLGIAGRAQKTAILCKNIIDGTGKTINGSAVIVEAQKIIGIVKKTELPKDATVIDLGDYTILPGMIDAHVHTNYTSDDYQVAHLKQSSATKALTGLKQLQDLLLAGWTTVRIAGDADVAYSSMDIKKAINKGLFIGPRIHGAAHYLSVTGGGGDINFISPEQKIIADGLIVNGPEEVRKAVREEIKYGSDWIKILATGAFMTVGDNPQNVHFSPEELKMAVEEAGRREVPVMAHAHATDGIKQAVKAGVRSIEHGSYMDEEALDLMVQHGTYLIPTLTIDLYFKEKIADSKALTKAIDLAKNSKAGMYRNLGIAVKKGVKIGVGTDYIGWDANFSAREFGELVTVGMTPMQAIQAGTKVNAELLKLDKEIGTIEVGKFADIIAVKGDPLTNISELQKIKFVMIGGKVVKNEK